MFSSAHYKSQIFTHIQNLRGLDEWKGIHLSDDIPNEDKLMQRDLRALQALARNKNIEASVRGTSIVVAGQQFKYSEIGQIPFGLTLAKAKMVETPDGLAFQSSHAPFSNLYKCVVKFEGQTFDSTERAYCSKMCIISNQMNVHRRVMTVRTPMDAMFAAKACNKTQEWYDMDEEVMARLQDIKFTDPALLHQLVETKGLQLYEATLDNTYGCGFHLGQTEQIKIENITHGNRLGEILMALRYKHTNEQPLITKEEAKRLRLEREKPQDQVPDQPEPDINNLQQAAAANATPPAQG